MKKVSLAKSVVLCLLLLIAIGLCSCEKDPVTPSEAGTPTTPPMTTQGITPLPSGPIEADNYAEYVTLGEYEGIKVAKAEISITDEERQKYTEYILSQFPDLTELPGQAAEIGHVVNVSYIGTIDGVEIDNQSGINIELGVGNYGEEFENQLLGVKAGDKKTVTINFPKGDDPVYSEKTAVFDVAVAGVYESGPSELTEKFVKESLGLESIEAFNKRVEDDLVAYAQEDADAKAEQEVFEKIIANATFVKDPTAEINRAVEEAKAYYITMASSQGMTFEDLLQNIFKKTAAEFEAQALVSCTYEVKRQMVAAAIVKELAIVVTDEERMEIMEEYASGTEYTAEDFYNQLLKTYTSEALIDIIAREKATTYVMSKVVYE